jgi:hypothetical protein
MKSPVPRIVAVIAWSAILAADITVACAAAAPALGQGGTEYSRSVGVFLRECTAPMESFEFTYCVGVVTGFREGLQVATAGDPDEYLDVHSKKVCLPDYLTYERLIAVFVRWARKHPEYHHFHRANGLSASWTLASFPCE